MNDHGGNIHAASRETGIPADRIIDFSASINPLGLPDSVVRVIRENLGSLVHYPEPFSDELAVHIGNQAGVDPGTVVCGNGSTELIYLITRAFAPRRILIPAPTFTEYERACALQPGSVSVRFPLLPGNNFDLDPDGFIAAMKGCDMAFLCNPNNPTGRMLKKSAVLAIAEAAERLSCRLVLDEAFIDFTPEESVVRDVAGNSHLIVLRSLTKFYALSGLRVGYGVFPKTLVESARRYKEPWTVNALAQKAAIAAINDRVYQDRTMREIRAGKQFLEEGLTRLGIRYFPSSPNYYLLKMEHAQENILALRKKGILVRGCSNFPGLDSSFVRIAVRSQPENEALLKELAASCAVLS